MRSEEMKRSTQSHVAPARPDGLRPGAAAEREAGGGVAGGVDEGFTRIMLGSVALVTALFVVVVAAVAFFAVRVIFQLWMSP